MATAFMTCNVRHATGIDFALAGWGEKRIDARYTFETPNGVLSGPHDYLKGALDSLLYPTDIRNLIDGIEQNRIHEGITYGDYLHRQLEMYDFTEFDKETVEV